MPAAPQLSPPRAHGLGQAPLAYTPAVLAEKIRTSRAALEGERKQVTVLFADLKDALALIRDLAPEAAQQLLDPALHAMMDAVHRIQDALKRLQKWDRHMRAPGNYVSALVRPRSCRQCCWGSSSGACNGQSGRWRTSWRST
jgi:hypothetical protein